MPYRNTSLCRYTGTHVTTCIPMGFTGSSLLLTGTLVGLTKQRDIIGFPAPYAHSTPVCPGEGLTEIHLGPHTPLGSRAAHGRSGSLSGRFHFKCADLLNVLQIKYRARAEMWETQMLLPRIQGLPLSLFISFPSNTTLRGDLLSIHPSQTNV